MFGKIEMLLNLFSGKYNEIENNKDIDYLNLENKDDDLL